MKKGMVLPINFLVILILSIVIFGFGVSFVYELYDGAQNQKQALDSRTQQEIERMLSTSGRTVYVPYSTAKLFRGESKNFNLGVLNNDANVKTFTISVVDPEGISSQFLSELTVQPFETEIALIQLKVNPDAGAGPVIVDITVNDNRGKVHGKEKIRIDIQD